MENLGCNFLTIDNLTILSNDINNNMIDVSAIAK